MVWIHAGPLGEDLAILGLVLVVVGMHNSLKFMEKLTKIRHPD